MGRFYFHLRDGDDSAIDPDGIEAEAESIVRRALREARSIIAADALEGRINLLLAIEVTDAGGSMIHRLDFTEAVEIVGSRPAGAAPKQG